jgi:hypothetical protein
MHPSHPLESVIGGKEVASTHEVLMDGLTELLAAADAVSAADPLVTIRESLPHHFDLEEDQGGMMEWISALLPDRRDEVRALIDDHRAMRDELAALTLPFRADGSRDQEATARMLAFADHLRAHERRESALLMVATEAPH